MNKKCMFCINNAMSNGVCESCDKNLGLIKKLKLGIPAIVNGKVKDSQGMNEVQCPKCQNKYKIKLVYT